MKFYEIVFLLETLKQYHGQKNQYLRIPTILDHENVTKFFWKISCHCCNVNKALVIKRSVKLINSIFRILDIEGHSNKFSF